MSAEKKIIFIIAILVFVFGVYGAYFYFNFFVNSSFFVAIVTLLVGGIAIYLYIRQKLDAKRDAARIIIQEIRRAEDIIGDYKQTGTYQFSKKIVATNSWTKNIHYFVGDLTNDELDKISDLYSTGEYLDQLVESISRITLETEIEFVKNAITSVQTLPQNITYQGAPQGQQQVVVPAIPPVWKPRLDVISLKIEPIYHSTIVGKLKKIAKIK